jgi:hypothetical protein
MISAAKMNFGEHEWERRGSRGSREAGTTCECKTGEREGEGRAQKSKP